MSVQLSARDSPNSLESAHRLHAEGLAYLRQGNAALAASIFRELTAILPDSAPTWNNLGVALCDLEDYEGAAACYQRALALAPIFPGACINLGNLLVKQGNAERAIAWYWQALRLNPEIPEAYCNLGNAYKDLGLRVQAEPCFQQALALDPNQASAHFHLASLCELDEDFAGAAAHYHECLRLQPRRVLRELRSITMCPTVFQNNAEIDHYRYELLREVQRFRDGMSFVSVPELTADGCGPPFNLPYHGRSDLSLKAAFASIYHDKIREAETDDWPSRRDGPGRIGFVVTRRHEAAFLRCMAGVLNRLPRDVGEIEVFCPATAETQAQPTLDKDRVKVTRASNHLGTLADLIRLAELDVLYHWETGTDATNYLLPFLRLATIQCTSWGVPVTSGIPEMDYYLSSAWLETPAAPEHYSERLIQLESLPAYYVRRPLHGDRKVREDFGLSAGLHVYLCTQYLGKYHPDFDAILAGILRADDLGIVAITADERDPAAIQLRQRFEHVMPDVSKRILYVSSRRDAEYLHLVSSCDVVLDPMHYGGAITMYDAFSLSQPVVTLPTQFQRGRYATAMYRRMGLDAGIATDTEDYIRRAVQLASDKDRREELRRSIADRSDALLEDESVVAAYADVLQRLVSEARSK